MFYMSKKLAYDTLNSDQYSSVIKDMGRYISEINPATYDVPVALSLSLAIFSQYVQGDGRLEVYNLYVTISSEDLLLSARSQCIEKRIPLRHATILVPKFNVILM